MVKKNTTLELIPAQNGFYCTAARYPAYVGGWGTGKTAVMIAKGVGLSKKFAKNVGLIVRKEYTDLRDSTIVDFEKYTQMRVDSEKNVRFKNGSLIMFRHASELANLQNINLGWFAIEQADELETDEQFQMLRGRLRLEGVPHFGMIIANTNGHNWVWDLWKRPNLKRDAEFELYEAETADNAANLPADFLADLAKLEYQKPRVWRQFVKNSWDDYGTDALFFGEQMSLARREGRIRPDLPIDKSVKVVRFWDIGSVHFACWFAQFIKDRINIIDYYHQDDPALGLPEAIEAVRSRGYVVDDDFCGPDIAKGAVNGKTIMNTFIVDEAARLGVKLTPVIQASFIDQIEAVRSIFNLLQFHEINCEDGILALDNYKRQPKSKISIYDRKEYADKEVHDWASHGGSALRYLAVAYRYMEIGGQVIGYPAPKVEFDPYAPVNEEYGLSLSRL